MDPISGQQISNPLADQPVSMELPSAFKLFKDALAFYKSHLLVILAISSVVAIVEIAQALIGAKVSGGVVVAFTIVVLVVSIFSRLALFAAVPEEEQA